MTAHSNMRPSTIAKTSNANNVEYMCAHKEYIGKRSCSLQAGLGGVVVITSA